MQCMSELVVAIVVFDGFQSLDAVGPHDVFSTATRLLDDAGGRGRRYRPLLVAAQGGPVVAEGGVRVIPDCTFDELGAVHTMLVAGGIGVCEIHDDPSVTTPIRQLAARARRTTAVCTGAFVLAGAGLLDHATVATHWARARELRVAYPTLDVDDDAIFRRDGRIWTSAGVTAGLDLALALVEDDFGAQLAQDVARWLVMPLRRAGGQSQYAPSLWHRPLDRDDLRSVQEAVVADPSHPWTVDEMARLAGRSPRHFQRVFTSRVGVPPGAWVERVRLDAARELLEHTSRPVAAVARSVGFGSAETLRRTFVARLHTSPSQYRQRFTLHPSS